jgi:hypothetical protein
MHPAVASQPGDLGFQTAEVPRKYRDDINISLQKTNGAVITVPQEESALKACHLQEGGADRYDKAECVDARLDLAAEMTHDSKVWVWCRKKPHVLALVELSGYLAGARYRKHAGGCSMWIGWRKSRRRSRRPARGPTRGSEADRVAKSLNSQDGDGDGVSDGFRTRDLRIHNPAL